MSQNQITVNMNHYDSGSSFVAGLRINTVEDTFVSNAISVSTTPESLSIGDIFDPRSVAIKCYGGDDLLVSIDGGSNYPFRLTNVGEVLLLRLDFESAREVSTIVCEADVSDSLDGDYIELEDRNGLVWAWFNTGGGAGAPTPTTERLVEVTIATDDTATTIATALAAALEADAEFSATAATTTVTATDVFSGARTTGTSAGTTGWASVTSDGGGSAYFDIRVKSDGTSQASVAVIPK